MPNKVKINSGPNFSWYILTIVLFILDINYGLAWLVSNAITAILIYCYLRYKHNPIIKSILDTDWYKITMGQVVFHKFPDAVAKYKFINRGKTQFPEGFAEALRKEVNAMGKLRLSYKEIDWLDSNWCMGMDYVSYLADFRFKPKQVIINQNSVELEVGVEGPWKETIFWEVPLMAIISELYFKMTGKEYDEKLFIMKSELKATKMKQAGVKWSDFGTRRRFSFKTQEQLNKVMNRYRLDGFVGTSNPYFAMKFNLEPIGTYAHEAIMAMQAYCGVFNSNREWMKLWCQEYDYYMRIALTDTLTTDVFLKQFDLEAAISFAGVRQDSGEPAEFARKIIDHYKKLGIDPMTKKIVFSDSLDADKAVKLHETFSNEIQCVMGIGTNLTNDCYPSNQIMASPYHKPLNMVIKLTDIDFGNGMVPVVKLSDDKGKHTGNSEVIERVKNKLGLQS